MNQDQKLPIVDPIPNSTTIQPPPSRIIERKVYIRVVENVTPHDFPQATRAWQALQNAGIEPGDLVANALVEGHNYKDNEFIVSQPFTQKHENPPLAESLADSTRLVSYQYVEDEKLLASTPPANGQNMEIVLTSKDLAKLEHDQTNKAVKMVAILAQKLPNLLK